MRYAEALSAAPKPMKEKAKPVKLERMTIQHAANGGHIVEHHLSGPNYEAPKPHVFGKGEGQKMMDHIKQHMGVKIEVEPEGEQD